MLVCLCHPTSIRDLDAVIDDGARSVQEIGQRCGAGTGCGACVDELRDRLAAKGQAGCGRDCAGDGAQDGAQDLVALRTART